MARQTKSTQDLLRTARKRFREAIDADQHNRDAAREDLRFLNGEQWPAQIKVDRESAGRPCLTINRLPGFVDQVVGDARQNKLGIKVRPVDDKSDPKTAEVYEGLIRNIEVTSGAEVAYQMALESAVQCGMGYSRVLTDYADDSAFDQEIFIELIRNPLSVVMDPEAQKADGSDARYCFITERLDKDEFRAKYPKANLSGWSESDGEEYRDWSGGEMIRVAEYFYKEPATRSIILLETGETMDEADYPALEALHLERGTPPPQIVRQRTAECHRVMWCKMAGGDVLEGPQEWPGKYIPVAPCWGKELNIDGKRCLRGLVRFARDPQLFYNFWRSTATELLGLSHKAPYLATTEQIKGHEQQWANANTASQPYILYNETGSGPPRREAPPPIPTGIVNEVGIAADELKSTTGIYDASLGAGGNEKSGKAILARQREGDVANIAYHDNLRRMIQFVGKILVDLIPKIYDTTRMVRIINPDDSEAAIQINHDTTDPATGQPVRLHDLAAGRYDVTVNVGPSFTTKRLEATESMLEFIRVYPPAAPLLGDLLVKNMDWPGADEVAERLKAALPPQLQGPQGPGAIPPAPGLGPAQAPQGPPQAQGVPPEIMAAMAQRQAAQAQQPPQRPNIPPELVALLQMQGGGR